MFRRIPLMLGFEVRSRKFAMRLLLISSLSPLATADILCTINAENYPGFEDGLVVSESFSLPAGSSGRFDPVEVHRTDALAFSLVPGRILRINDQQRLMDFYSEIQDVKSGRVFRARSGELGGNDVARAELPIYPAGNRRSYEGIVIFSCKRYFE